MVKLVAQGTCIPHILKAHYGGEDAHVIDEAAGLVVFSDGVGGYEKLVETQVADYSHALVSRVAQECREGASLKEAIQCAHLAVDLPGAATICVVQQLAMGGNKLCVANLGDCRVVLFRGGMELWSSPVMQHTFNCPMQLGHPLHHPCSDTADRAAFFELEVQPGDVLLMGTDGLWDNVWLTELQQLLPTSSCALQDCATRIAQLAFNHSMDESYLSPFAMEAAQHFAGFDCGGKPDDITVLVALVTADDMSASVDTARPATTASGLSSPVVCALVGTDGKPGSVLVTRDERRSSGNAAGGGAASNGSIEAAKAVACPTTLLPQEACAKGSTSQLAVGARSSAPMTLSVLDAGSSGSEWQPQVVWCPTHVQGGVVMLAWVELGTGQWLACAQLDNGTYWPVSQNEHAALHWWNVGDPLPLLQGAVVGHQPTACVSSRSGDRIRQLGPDSDRHQTGSMPDGGEGKVRAEAVHASLVGPKEGLSSNAAATPHTQGSRQPAEADLGSRASTAGAGIDSYKQASAPEDPGVNALDNACSEAKGHAATQCLEGFADSNPVADVGCMPQGAKATAGNESQFGEIPLGSGDPAVAAAVHPAASDVPVRSAPLVCMSGAVGDCDAGSMAATLHTPMSKEAESVSCQAPGHVSSTHVESDTQSVADGVAVLWMTAEANAPSLDACRAAPPMLCFGSWTQEEVRTCIMPLA